MRGNLPSFISGGDYVSNGIMSFPSGRVIPMVTKYNSGVCHR